MRIAAHLGVKDEVELIGPCIEHLHRIGVTQFFVCDLASTDGTQDVLSGMEGRDFRILHLSNADAGETWVTKNNEFLADCDAGWLIFLDADEFPLPASGHLENHLPQSPRCVLSIPRYNVPLGPAGPRMPPRLSVEHYAAIDLIAAAVPDFRKRLQAEATLPWIRAVPAPKVIAPRELAGSIVAGGHAVLSRDGRQAASMPATGLIMAHVPLSTLPRFERKVENFREFFAHQDSYAGSKIGWHWRRWIALADEGRLGDEFLNSVFDDAAVEALHAEGIIRSAAELLAP